MSTLYIVKFIITGVLLIILAIAIKVKKDASSQHDDYNQETLESARQYKESGEAERYKKQLEEAELKAFLNTGYEDEDTNE